MLVGLLLVSEAGFAQYAGTSGLGNGGWLSSLCPVAGSLQEAVRIFAFVAIIALGLMIMFMELPRHPPVPGLADQARSADAKDLLRYRRQGLTYDPWPSRWQRRNVRPVGFSAGALL